MSNHAPIESADEQQRRAGEKWNSGAMDGGPTTTPTAVLAEEAEKMAVRALDGTASREEKSALFASLAAALRRAEAEREEARGQRDLVRASLEALANGARVVPCSGACDESKPCLACRGMQNLRDWVKDCEQAEAERDAQQALVLRLTGERDELLESVEELRALGFGLGCMLTNAQWRERDAAERAQRGLKLMQSCLQDEERKVSELTATRDLLTDENARLQARVATMELLLRGGK